MKLLQIGSGDFFSTYGGGQVYVRRLVEALNRHEEIILSVVSISSVGESGVREILIDDVTVYQISSAEVAAGLRKVIQRVKPDVVHAHGLKSVAAKVCHDMGIPCVVTAHHGGILCPAGTLLNNRDKICDCCLHHNNCLGCVLNNIRWGKYVSFVCKWIPEGVYLRVGQWMRKLPFILFVTPVLQAALHIKEKRLEWQNICRHSSRIIAPSQAIAAAMLRNGLAEDKMVVVPHGVEPPSCTPAFPSIKDGRIKFYYVGRICRVKGLHVLLEAFRKVASPNIELHIIGGAGNKQEECYLKGLQYVSADDNRIIWHGKIPEKEVNVAVEPYHVMVHPTIFLEVFGLNIAEALSLGKWVLATRCGGAEMQIEEGKNGWLVEPNSVEALKMAIERIIQFPPTESPQCKGYISMEEHAECVMQVCRDCVTENK